MNQNVTYCLLHITKSTDKNNVFLYISLRCQEIFIMIVFHQITVYYHPFLQILKAFDKVWHNCIICKLRQNGTSDNILNSLFNFLRNRKQRVVFNGQASSLADVNAWVSKVSHLANFWFWLHKQSRWQLIKCQAICRWHFITFRCSQCK